MKKKQYNWDTSSWEDEKEINRRKGLKNKEINKLIFWVIIVFIFMFLAFFFNYVPKGKEIKEKIFNKKEDVIIDNWDYESEEKDSAISNFNMNDAQEELLSQEDFVAPTASPNGNGKVSVPNVESSSNIIIIEQSDVEKK